VKIENIVINTYAFLDDLKAGMPQAEMLKKISTLGIKKVEVRREFIKNFKKELNDIKNTSDRLGLEVFYSVPDTLFKGGILQTEAIKNYCCEAKTMGCRNIKFNIGEYNLITNEDINEINSLSESDYIKFTIENNINEVEGKSKKIKNFMDECKRLNLKIKCTFDVGNWIWQNEDPEKNAQLLKDEVTYIHLKDVSIENGPKAVLLDEGVIPWKRILRVFKDDLPVAIEYPCYPDPISILKGEIQKLLTV
jgi:sugar phosphate isomerase/epimerase